RLVQAVELPHQGALSRDILTEQGMHLSRLHVETDLGVGHYAGKALHDIAHLRVTHLIRLLKEGRPSGAPEADPNVIFGYGAPSVRPCTRRSSGLPASAAQPPAALRIHAYGRPSGHPWPRPT